MSYHATIISACINENIPVLKRYYAMGVDFNSIYDKEGDPLLIVAIKYDSPNSFNALINMGIAIDTPSLDNGCTPLNFAAIVNAPDYAFQLVNYGANLNTQDFDGFTPLNNALYFENNELANYFVSLPNVDVNIPAFDSLLPIHLAYFSEQFDTLDNIIDHPQFDGTFNAIYLQSFPPLLDYLKESGVDINETLVELFDQTKLFGLKFDLSGEFLIHGIQTHGNEESFDFWGYNNIVGLEKIVLSYEQFYIQTMNQTGLPSWAQDAITSVRGAVNFSRHCDEPMLYLAKIMTNEPVLIPSGWDGHSIAFVIHGDHLYRCNRGDLSDGVHGIDEFIITKPSNLTPKLIEHMLMAEGEPDFLQYDIIDILGLEKIYTVENPTQIAGNCVWTSLETGVEALFITTFLDLGFDTETAHHLAKQTFLLWEDFELDLSLNNIVSHSELYIEAGVYDTLLISALEAHHDSLSINDIEHGVIILNQLDEPSVFSTFDEKIGQYVMEYDPSAYHKISYLEPYTPSWGDYLSNFIFSSPENLTPDNLELAKLYFDFLLACDQYQMAHPELVISYNDVIYSEMSLGLDLIFSDTVSDIPVANYANNSSLDTYSITPIASINQHLSHEQESYLYA